MLYQNCFDASTLFNRSILVCHCQGDIGLATNPAVWKIYTPRHKTFWIFVTHFFSFSSPVFLLLLLLLLLPVKCAHIHHRICFVIFLACLRGSPKCLLWRSFHISCVACCSCLCYILGGGLCTTVWSARIKYAVIMMIYFSGQSSWKSFKISATQHTVIQWTGDAGVYQLMAFVTLLRYPLTHRWCKWLCRYLFACVCAYMTAQHNRHGYASVN